MIVPSFFLCVQKEERTFLRFYCHAYILVHSVLVIIRTTAVNDCLLYRLSAVQDTHNTPAQIVPCASPLAQQWRTRQS